MAVRCMIVDDDDNFLRVASQVLDSEGITVVGAVSNGAQAFRAARQLHPDVALVDINLGAESGFDVARLLASQPEADPLRVILISASSGDASADLIADSPAVSFLPKERLSGTAIRAILAGRGSTVPPGQRDSR